MKIICAGMPKTGTKSMARALEILGYNNNDSIPQMFEFSDEWYDLLFHGKEPNYEAMFKDVDSVTDMPACFFFEEILATFPDAKVILMTREEDSWSKSLTFQLRHFHAPWPWYKRYPYALLSPTYRKVVSIAFAVAVALYGSTNPDSTQVHRKLFQMYNTRVKAVVPKEQLLVYCANQGWRPLCEFLGCEVPAEPFPHENKSASMWRLVDNERIPGIYKMERQLMREVWPRLAGIGCVITCLVYSIYCTRC